jgi:hypothetical protein
VYINPKRSGGRLGTKGRQGGVCWPFLVALAEYEIFLFGFRLFKALY